MTRLPLHASCEKLLALATHTVLPTLIPLNGRAFAWGFEYDFIAETTCEEGILPLITEAMRRLISEDIAFETLSMVPSNAAAFLQKSQPLQAELCKEYPSNIVPLCKIKKFYDICPEPLLETSRAIGHFALYELIQLPESIVRIRGVAFDDKKLLKSYLKQVERAKASDPVRVAEELNLLSLVQGEAVWHPEGIALKRRLEQHFNRALKTSRYKEFFCSDAKLGAHALLERDRKSKISLPYRLTQQVELSSDAGEGLFEVTSATGKVLYSFCHHTKLVEELISSLQFLQQMASILQIEYTFVLFERSREKETSLSQALKTLGYSFETRRSDVTQVELQLFDLRGRDWPVSRLTVEVQNLPCIECVAILSYERIIALLLEKAGGFLPFALAPLQIMLLSVEQECVTWIEEFAKRLQAEGFRVDTDCRQVALGEKMYNAGRVKAACAVVVGKQELKNQLLSVRWLPESSESVSMLLEQFVEKIKMEEKTNT